MKFTIGLDGKLYNENGKSIPFTKLSGLVLVKMYKVKAGKEKGAFKLEAEGAANTKQRKSVVEPEYIQHETEESDDTDDGDEGNAQKRQCRAEPLSRKREPNQFLKFMNIKPDKEKGFDKVNDNVKPIPRNRPAEDGKKYSVTCFVCNRSFKVARWEVPPSIEGEQMNYRCNKCCKR